MPFLIDKKARRYCNRIFAFFLVISVLVITGGCGGEEEKKNAEKVYEYTQGQLSLQLKVDKQRITVADTLKVTLIAKAPEEWSIKFPEYKDKVGDFELDGLPEIENDIGEDGSEVISILKMSLMPFLPDKYKLLAISVEFSGANDAEFDLVTEELVFDVGSVIAPEEERVLKDIRGVLALQKSYLYWYIAGVVILLVLVIAAVIIVRKIISHRARLRALRFPHELALERLALLEKSDLIIKNKFALFYAEVTDILRHYINMRFEIKAEESTTEEFLHSISNKNILLREYSDLLKKFLEQCDLVKFARVNPSKTDCNNILVSCREFVMQTKRQDNQLNNID